MEPRGGAPSLAVVICTRNRPERLRRVLADLREQPPDELVVIDQSDEPVPLGGVAHVVDAGRGLPRARNLGLRHVRAEIVLFLDDDVLLLPGCVEAHRRAYEDPRVGGVVGRTLERSLRPNARRTTNRVDRAGRVRTRLDGLERGPIETLKGANMSFRRRALLAVGGFDEGYAGTAFLEDADASTRVAARGWALRFEPEAAVVHLSEPTGGVRVGDRLETERWRFHNTGRFVRLHRRTAAALPMAAVFGAVALRRAIGWRRPDVVPVLLGALWRGWSEAGREGAGAGAGGPDPLRYVPDGAGDPSEASREGG